MMEFLFGSDCKFSATFAGGYTCRKGTHAFDFKMYDPDGQLLYCCHCPGNFFKRLFAPEPVITSADGTVVCYLDLTVFNQPYFTLRMPDGRTERVSTQARGFLGLTKNYGRTDYRVEMLDIGYSVNRKGIDSLSPGLPDQLPLAGALAFFTCLFLRKMNDGILWFE
ncbi:MAG: hypothetical protein IJ503_03130 [Akkermansia sp.]|nr:hypothetical protein [Akkermansia sp.]MBQ8900212.1 hypothetical protein [Akkermansia sp.]